VITQPVKLELGCVGLRWLASPSTQVPFFDFFLYLHFWLFERLFVAIREERETRERDQRERPERETRERDQRVRPERERERERER